MANAPPGEADPRTAANGAGKSSPVSGPVDRFALAGHKSVGRPYTTPDITVHFIQSPGIGGRLFTGYGFLRYSPCSPPRREGFLDNDLLRVNVGAETERRLGAGTTSVFPFGFSG